jgi:hypothetical protein
MKGWRQALMFRLLHRFSDPMYLEAQQADEEYRQIPRQADADFEPPGEAEYQELLRLLREEIASVREECEYAEKANEERAAIERDACLAPEGETWSMMLRQEAALDRSIDRKVRILLRLRKDLTNLPITPPDQDDGGRMENIGEVLENDITPENSQGVETVEELKMNERCGNVIENKGSDLEVREGCGKVIEKPCGYAQSAGMLLKRNGVI